MKHFSTIELNHNFIPKLHRKDSVEGREKGKQTFFHNFNRFHSSFVDLFTFYCQNQIEK